ncbi:MAG: hypothetical protein JWN23_2423 [Rhodocyclales bacterium]|nr:hypothetical protein [Rhodocyclales bacterium]
MKVYKVYVHTTGDPHVSEVVVAASTKKEASELALSHVKKANPHKGVRTAKQSIEASKVLYARAAGTNGCVVIHRIPMDAFKGVMKNMG